MKIIQISAAALVIILVGSALYFLKSSDISAVVGLPMLVVGAVVMLLILLGSMSVLYASYDIHDRTQALALPEGSIRAVIALMLIVLFAILSIYLYGSIAEGKLVLLGEMSSTAKDSLAAVYKTDNMIVVPGATAETFKVWVRQGTSSDGVAFAKELLVLVGTLVTSISSFYFGAKTASTSTAETEQKKIGLTKLEPSTYVRGSSAQGFTASGTELQRVASVKLVNGQNEVDVSALATAPDKITFTAQILNTMPAGAWDVKVVDGSGKTSVRTGMLTVT